MWLRIEVSGGEGSCERYVVLLCIEVRVCT
jgi:hypothetical protein